MTASADELGEMESRNMGIPVSQARGMVLEASAQENGVPRPQLAVSPSLARELVVLRSPPRPVTPDVELVQAPRLVLGPRLVSRADFEAQQSLAQTGATNDATSGLQLPVPSAPADSVANFRRVAPLPRETFPHRKLAHRTATECHRPPART